ncbi:flagellar protein FlaG [Pseudomonas benzenivorans]|uniref:Flagellar protein FlaG n=2 Tax=Pseudomonas benzenivorans TaxID=556533 RepID=A0ABZ0PZE3_9PSED|nr:flagellar protein FlaG [Pseudomonas benzenivorans]WPC06588.1 flagellar protein FlaG [Pseudomonas benzenivorans]
MDINGLKGISPVFTAERVMRSEAPAAARDSSAERQPVPSSAGQSAAALSPTAESQRQPVEEAVSSIKQFAQSIQRNLDFDLDDSTGRVVVRVTDGVSGEVIRQIPSEEALRLAERLDEARSLLFKAEA